MKNVVHQHVQHAVQADAVVVGLHQEVRRDLDAGEGEGLQEPGDHATEKGHEADGDIGAGEAGVGGDGVAGGGRHGRGSTMIVPAMVW
jgi:hypothetical protein